MKVFMGKEGVGFFHILLRIAARTLIAAEGVMVEAGAESTEILGSLLVDAWHVIDNDLTQAAKEDFGAAHNSALQAQLLPQDAIQLLRQDVVFEKVAEYPQPGRVAFCIYRLAMLAAIFDIGQHIAAHDVVERVDGLLAPAVRPVLFRQAKKLPVFPEAALHRDFIARQLLGMRAHGSDFQNGFYAGKLRASVRQQMKGGLQGSVGVHVRNGRNGILVGHGKPGLKFPAG